MSCNLSRRSLLQALLAKPSQPGIIDAHVHFYDPTRLQGIPWPPKDDPLHRKVLPGPWASMVRPLGVTGVVVVEASPWLDDNQWILDLAKDNPVIVGFVGHLEPGTTDFRRNLERFSRNPLFQGIRLNANQLSSVLSGAGSDLRYLSDANIALDVIGDGAMLIDVATLANRLPRLRIVIDHLPFAAPAGALEVLRDHPNVYAKVSGKIERGIFQPIDDLWNIFGPDRLIYASNWPVCERYAQYATVLQTVQEYFRGKGPQSQDKFFRTNSAAAYRWVAR